MILSKHAVCDINKGKFIKEEKVWGLFKNLKK